MVLDLASVGVGVSVGVSAPIVTVKDLASLIAVCRGPA